MCLCLGQRQSVLEGTWSRMGEDAQDLDSGGGWCHCPRLLYPGCLQGEPRCVWVGVRPASKPPFPPGASTGPAKGIVTVRTQAGAQGAGGGGGRSFRLVPSSLLKHRGGFAAGRTNKWWQGREGNGVQGCPETPLGCVCIQPSGFSETFPLASLGCPDQWPGRTVGPLGAGGRPEGLGFRGFIRAEAPSGFRT